MLAVSSVLLNISRARARQQTTDHNYSLLPGALDDTAEQQTTSAAGTVTQAKAAKAPNGSTNQYSITQMPEDFKVREHTQKGQALSAESGCLF